MPRKPVRREPMQLRARQTVEVILDAVTRVVQRHGLGALTTNRIAEAAGVSIGSVYQYFPDKAAIYQALHDRHVGDVGRLVERTLVDHARASLADLVRALVDALVDAHARAPELGEVLATLPGRADSARGFAARLHNTLHLAIAARRPQLVADGGLDRVLFVVTHQLDALCHAAALRRPPRVSLAAAKDEVARAILAYVSAPRRSPTAGTGAGRPRTGTSRASRSPRRRAARARGPAG
jgi:AcrR family transcriptional regulator